MRFYMRVKLWQIAANKSRSTGKIFTHKLVWEESEENGKSCLRVEHQHHKHHQTQIFKFGIMRNVFIVFKWCCFFTFRSFATFFMAARPASLVWGIFLCRRWEMNQSLSNIADDVSDDEVPIQRQNATNSFVINYERLHWVVCREIHSAFNR